jgi:GNAT superfamily N-acetyltransferase
MANIEDPTPVVLTRRHVPDAMALVAEAGWNQCADDWRMMLGAGTGFGFEDASGRLIASAVVLPYGAGIGWIGMVLVSGAHQRRGLATRLIDRAVGVLESIGLSPCLDATPAGEPVYLKRGFTPVFTFHRWQREGTDSGPLAVPGLGRADIEAVQHLDRQAFGGDRKALLADVIARHAPCVVAVDGTGFALSRAGRRAHQIGPIVAGDRKTAIALFDIVNGSLGTRVFIDIPDHHAGLTDHAQTVGFTRQRPLKRMIKGGQKTQGPGDMFAIFGPELG